MRKNNSLLAIVVLTLLLVGCSPRINSSKIQRSSSKLENIQFEAKGSYAKPVIRYFIKKINSPDKIYITSEIHTYLHVETTVNAVVDLLKLGSVICTSLTGKVQNLQ